MLLVFLTSRDSRPLTLWATLGAVVTVSAHVALRLLRTPPAPLPSANTATAFAIVGGLAGASLWWLTHPAAAAEAVHLARVTTRAFEGDSDAATELVRLTNARWARLRALAETSRSAERRLLRELSAEYAELGALLAAPAAEEIPAFRERLAIDRALLSAEIAAIKSRRGRPDADTDP
jgi:Spy/CpxP family protein refolding chaperone